MSKSHFTTIALVLAMATSVHAQSYKLLYNFGSNPGDPTGPRYSGTIAQSPGGNLYSTADDHWTDGLGTAFKMSVNGTLTVLHRFGGIGGQAPTGGLVFATDQRFHGTTEFGGLNGHGTIFRIAPDGKVRTLYSFTGGADGSTPEAAPIQSVAGHYYGTTYGGNGNFGSVYKMTTVDEFILLHTFVGTDGANPLAPLIQGSDYGFYGTTQTGGTHDAGTIFRISSQGYFKVLYNFDWTHGGYPYSPLIQASDGNFYGVTARGGPSGWGVLFKMTPSHTLTVLHTFDAGHDGGNQVGGLVEATDGNLYGTNNIGGANGWGVLFRITKAGAFAVLHDFDWNSGASPQTTLVQHTNGKFYADTAVGGTATQGVFYRFDLGLPPFVTFLSVYGRVGAHVDILGQHFTDASVVSFNGVPAQNPEIQPTYIKAIVPDGATTGLITVTTTSGTLKSNKVFVIH